MPYRQEICRRVRRRSRFFRMILESELSIVASFVRHPSVEFSETRFYICSCFAQIGFHTPETLFARSKCSNFQRQANRTNGLPHGHRPNGRILHRTKDNRHRVCRHAPHPEQRHAPHGLPPKQHHRCWNPANNNMGHLSLTI